ncbi:MAG: hypothetical protein Q4P34_01455 [Tissierellia bacterium]|nr:hypothetical protein [Tissierellia bacterium]
MGIYIPIISEINADIKENAKNKLFLKIYPSHKRQTDSDIARIANAIVGYLMRAMTEVNEINTLDAEQMKIGSDISSK